MDYLLLLLSLLLLLVGLVGSMLPLLPGPPISWFGILLLYLTFGVPFHHGMVWGSLVVTIVVSVLDYVIPSIGTKRFGGTRFGVWGTNIGLLIGLFFPPLGIIIGPFVGALVGEFIHDSRDVRRAFKAAVGAFMGFMASTFLKLILCLAFLGLFVVKVIEYWSDFKGF
ncbi:MAG: DUF456 domain-containing protein [Flavobacterium sp.]